MIAALVATAFLAAAPAMAKTAAPKAAHHGTVAKKSAMHKMHKTAAKADSKMAPKSNKMMMSSKGKMAGKGKMARPKSKTTMKGKM